MRNIRLLLGYCPVFGKDLSHELIKWDEVEFCYNATEFYCYTEEDSKIVNFNINLGRTAAYEKVFDLNKLPALSKEIIDKMRPFESMAIKLEQRRTNFPIEDYEEAKYNYLKHLRFWNYIIEEYRINMCHFDEAPHSAYTYIIYGLSVIKKIPSLICFYTSISNLRTYGNSIESVGMGIKEYYEKYVKNIPIEQVELSGTVSEYYEKYSRPIDTIKSERKEKNFEKNDLKKNMNTRWGNYLGKNGFMKTMRRRIGLLTTAVFKHHDWAWYLDRRPDLDRLRKECSSIKYYFRHSAMSLKQYNEIAQVPDYNQKFIYFALQLTPEGTTLPIAGAFVEQYTSIQLLARAAEKEDVLVYVKEHFGQAFRDKVIYQTLREIPNVRLIKSTESSFDLMTNCIAVATQTGSCILEGALLGKPALVFGDGYSWKGFPSIFDIYNEDQGAQVIHDILAEFSISHEQIKRYFYSIQKNSIYCYQQADWWNQLQRPEHKESVKNLLNLIKKFINETTN